MISLLINALLIFNCFFSLCNSQELPKQTLSNLERDLSSMKIMHETIIKTIEEIEINKQKFNLKAQGIEAQLKKQENRIDLKELFTIAITHTKKLQILKKYWEERLIDLEMSIEEKNKLLSPTLNS